ncbi:HAD-IIB family hydrolase [Cellulomonas soli]|uniref:HAD-IIB family hydrolase n=1 Tax=Cellulomonas soli TaxID=931535 RepID=UPI003F878846
MLEPPVLDAVPDVRLIAVDMDGSLLDEHDRIDASLWPLLDELDRRGIAFCPASGRQYANLRGRFERDDLVYIAENGAYVVRDGQRVSSDGIDLGTMRALVEAVRRHAVLGGDVGVVVCGARSAYVERTDEAFLDQACTYYARLETVEDLTLVDDEILKVAVYDFGSAQDGVAHTLRPFEGAHRVVISGAHWVDVMSLTADKGAALRQVQAELGIGPEHTMAFGDYLNDLGLLAAADWSFAMDNAHPQVRERARFVAPANTVNGVVRSIVAALGLHDVLGSDEELSRTTAPAADTH